MKSSINIVKSVLLLGIVLLSTTSAQAQFLDKLLKKAERAAERAVERKVERKVEKETEKAMDSILDPNKKSNKKPKKQPTKTTEPKSTSTKVPKETQEESNPPATTDVSETDPIQVNTKFDFVPGDKILLQDDFSKEFLGDFPKNWDSSGGGSIVTLGDDKERWFELNRGNNVFYCPDVTLPQEYTIEFDLTAIDLAAQDLYSGFAVILSNNNKFDRSHNGKWSLNNYMDARDEIFGLFSMSLDQGGYRKKNRVNVVNSYGIQSKLEFEDADILGKKPHIAIAVNKKRFRMWCNDKKYIDIPRFIQDLDVLKYVKFSVRRMKQGRVFIKNLKIAEGGIDLRRELLDKGRYTSNGILFNSGSATLKLQSYGIIKQVSQALQNDDNMKLKITGHTDSDGNEADNLALSKARAQAVKKALVEVYGIAENRLTTDGKGEADPVADNTSPKGKAQNRRVEFTTYQ